MNDLLYYIRLERGSREDLCTHQERFLPQLIPGSIESQSSLFHGSMARSAEQPFHSVGTGVREGGSLACCSFLEQYCPILLLHTPFSGRQPKLTILTTQASIGQTPELSLAGFTPNTSVRLTHDGGQLVQITTGASVVTVGQDGTTLVEIFVDRSFLVGLHVIEAQETTNHVTVRATLGVVGANPARSPQLALGVTSLDMGADRQGTKSVRSFLLENVGGGSIAWSVGEAGPAPT